MHRAGRKAVGSSGGLVAAWRVCQWQGPRREPPLFLLITAKTKTALHCLDTLLARKPDLGATLPSEMDWKGGNALAYARYYKLPAVVARLQKAGIKR
nr:hypothetical protein [Armatimonas sp.]